MGDKLTVIDEPHMVGTSGARYFDGEGVATKRMPVFENGILKTYYIDTYSANKMNMSTNGLPPFYPDQCKWEMRMRMV